MKEFAAYYPGVYTYADTSRYMHPWFPSYNPEIAKAYFEVVNMYEWEGVAGQPAVKVAEINYDYLATFRHSASQLRDRLHQKARQGQQAIFHGRELHENAQPDQS